MKNSWFELMLNFFEKSLAYLKDAHAANKADADVHEHDLKDDALSEMMPRVVKVHVEQLNSSRAHSMRVFTLSEQLKLTKASHQFLVRMASWGIVSSDVLELIMNRLFFSESRIVSLQETKWVTRHTLANGLSPDQVAFLDLILYQKEDRYSLH